MLSDIIVLGHVSEVQLLVLLTLGLGETENWVRLSSERGNLPKEVLAVFESSCRAREVKATHYKKLGEVEAIVNEYLHKSGAWFSCWGLKLPLP